MIRTPTQWATAVARNREIALASDLGGACQITHGRYFWPLEPRHPGNDFDIEFIAHSLATKTRWAGVMADENGDPIEYCVAQHSVIVADLVQMARTTLVPGFDWLTSASPALFGLMHDATEAYLEDVPRPIKPRLGDYYGIEAALNEEIMVRFDVPLNGSIIKAVKIVDNLMIFLERDRLVGQPVVPYENENQHPGLFLDRVVPEFRVWSPKEAKRKFLEKYEEIVKHDGNYVPREYRGRGYGL
jgi:5'-deoxynucleotidase YfbR-like HD superfamily hydrolase